MAKGNEAKSLVVEKMREAFGEDWIGESGGKYYVWSKENGQKIQIAIGLTCPKVPIETDAATPGSSTGKMNFTGDFSVGGATVKQPAAEITDKEREQIAELMERLGL